MPSLRGKKRKLQESIICSSRTHNLRSREENNSAEESATIISTDDKKIDTLKTVAISEGNEPNEVSINHKKSKTTSKEPSMENIESNVCVSDSNIDNAIHSLSTNVVDNVVNSTSSNDEDSNNFQEAQSNGLTGSIGKLADVSEADCLNDKNTVSDNNSTMVVGNDTSSDILLKCNDSQPYKAPNSVFYQSINAELERKCGHMLNIVDQVKSQRKEKSAHYDITEVKDTLNEDKFVQPTSDKISPTTNNKGAKFNLNTGIPDQTNSNNNIESVQSTINVSQTFEQEVEINSTTVREATSRPDLVVEIQLSNGSINACTENDNAMNNEGLDSKALFLCSGETCIESDRDKDVTNKAVKSSNRKPELSIHTEIVKDKLQLPEASHENNSTLSGHNKETSEINDPDKTDLGSDSVNKDTLCRIPPSSELGLLSHSRDKVIEISDKPYLSESQSCLTSDAMMKTDLKSTLEVPDNQSLRRNDVLTSTNQMSSMQFKYDYNKAISTGDMAGNTDVKDKSCSSNESSNAIISCNEAVLYIDSHVTKSSSRNSKTTHTLGSSLTNESSLEVLYSNHQNLVLHNEGQTLAPVEQQSATFQTHTGPISIENSTARWSLNRNTENIDSSDCNRKDQVPSNDISNTDRIKDHNCDFSSPEGSKQPTQKEIVEPCEDNEFSDVPNSQVSTQNFLESSEAEKAESNEMEIAEFERTFVSAQRWSRELVEKKKTEGAELVNGILAELCEMNQELMAMKRKLDIVKREMTNNHPKPNTSKFFSKTNSNFSFFK